jgi:hypothetical protein
MTANLIGARAIQQAASGAIVLRSFSSLFMPDCIRLEQASAARFCGTGY